MTKKKDELIKEIESLEEQIKQVKTSLEIVVRVVEGKDEDKVKTYIDGFDEALDGGFQKRHVVLISGSTGTLKSTLALSILYHNLKEKGSKGLYLTLEEPKESLKRTMEDLKMNDFNEKDLMIVDIGRMRNEHEEVNQESDWFSIIEEYLKKKVETDKISLVVLDSLTALTSLASSENLRTDLFQFFSFLKTLGVTSFLITEPEANGASQINGVEKYLSDSLINLGFSESNGRVEFRIQCIKLRHSDHSHDYFTLSNVDGRFVAIPENGKRN